MGGRWKANLVSRERLLFKMRDIISCLSTDENHPIEEKKLKKKAGFNARERFCLYKRG